MLEQGASSVTRSTVSRHTMDDQEVCAKENQRRTQHGHAIIKGCQFVKIRKRLLRGDLTHECTEGEIPQYKAK
jgi:hypothetical protein